MLYISKKEFNAINEGVFNPLNISKDVQKLFEENALRLGLPNPLDQAINVIESIKDRLSILSLTNPELPEIENPFRNIQQPTLAPIQGLPQLPNPTQIQGYGQVNLPETVVGNQINPITKLTQAEEQLLSPAEKLIRQRQRTA